MTKEEKLNQLSIMLDMEDACDLDILSVYLDQAKEKILNKRYPYGDQPEDVDKQYEYLQLELTISLYNQRGAEGQKTHNENGVSRTWRTPNEILAEIPSWVGLPL